MFIDIISVSVSSLFVPRAYLGLLPLALGEGDAAGDGLATGLGATGALSVVALGDATGDGLAVAGEFELFAGSQPTANIIESIVRSKRAVRLIVFMFGVFIGFLASFQQD